jgi:serine/threonine-protein kinase
MPSLSIVAAVAQPSDHAPTLTSPAMTMGGMILGTAAYMAPEQARGRAIDKRADIWAFGCVFYEMVTGERVFRGDDLTEVLASVLRDRPDFGKAPSSVRRLLQKCLEKEPRHRLRDLGDAWELVEDGAPRVSGPVPRIARLPWAVAALLALVAATLGIVAARRTPAAAPVVQFQFPVPEEVVALDGPFPRMAAGSCMPEGAQSGFWSSLFLQTALAQQLCATRHRPGFSSSLARRAPASQSTAPRSSRCGRPTENS